MEMKNMSKRQQPDQRANNSRCRIKKHTSMRTVKFSLKKSDVRVSNKKKLSKMTMIYILTKDY